MVLLIGVAGFCIGGMYEMIGNEELVVLAEREGGDITFLANIKDAGLHVWIGLTQLLIGVISQAGTY